MIKNIFHYAPFYPRYEYIINDEPQVLSMSRYDKTWRKQFGTFCEDSLINEDQRRFMYDTNIYAIKGIAKELGVNYYVSDYMPKYSDFDGSLRVKINSPSP